MGLRESDQVIESNSIFEVNRNFRALDIGEWFYMELEGMNCHSARETAVLAICSEVPTLPFAQNEPLARLRKLVNDHKEVNQLVAEDILKDLAMIDRQGFISLMNFLCKVRNTIHTKPQSEQGAPFILN